MIEISKNLKGCLAISKAGHDKGNVFVIIKEEDGYVYLADGKRRTMDKLKKKKRKHIQPVYHTDKEIADKLENGQTIINEDIKRTIKMWNNSLKNAGGNENV